MNRRDLLSFVGGFLAVSAVAIPFGIWGAVSGDPVYGKPDDFVVSRPAVEKGEPDRIFIKAKIRKLRNCDLEAGAASPYVSFHDGNLFVPPPAALMRPDGLPAGNTHGNSGETISIAGYSAVVPVEVREKPTTFVVKVPCKTWDFDAATGEKVWGDAIVAVYGPIPVPDVGGISVDETKAKQLMAGSLKPGDLK